MLGILIYGYINMFVYFVSIMALLLIAVALYFGGYFDKASKQEYDRKAKEREGKNINENEYDYQISVIDYIPRK